MAGFNIGDELKIYGPRGDTIGTSPYGKEGEFFLIFWTIVKNLYLVAGIILMFFLIAGGLGMIINAGNAEKLKQSSQTVTSAVIGYLIMFAAYWLVRIVEIVFGVKIIL
ncbi:MAG: hypothetical protein U1C50_04200 [Patescibacteria group bacterium]|nr:hypothetical protein [bacterium]MDZ4229423.1 hypothetical protein [Patescibacteria group bacterium]